MESPAVASHPLRDPNRSHQEQEQEQATMQKYTCPMHSEVTTDHPGNCPKCGMKLVPLKQGERGTSNVQPDPYVPCVALVPCVPRNAPAFARGP